MTDRELLELAVKAAGVEGKYWDSDIDIHRGIAPVNGTKYWTPLTDDGDALRLAVKLGMDLYLADEIIAAEFSAKRISPREFKSNDPYAATRRAIVRAAAEIGKGQ